VEGIFTSEELESFKRAGGFNSDWDLTFAVVLLYLFKHTRYARTGIALKEYPPSVAEYTDEIARRGGWLRAAEAILFEQATPEEAARIRALWQIDEIRQTFQELFAGDLCEAVYGFPAKRYPGPGLIRRDRPLIDLARLPERMKRGILTGRTAGETQIGLKLIGANGHFPPSAILTEDDGIKKPHPLALKVLCSRLQARCGIYIGDTPDDLTTVELHRLYDATPMLSGMVLSGPGGKTHRQHFLRRGADIIAPDVNTILDLFREERWHSA